MTSRLKTNSLFIVLVLFSSLANAQDTFMDSVIKAQGKLPHHIWEGSGDDNFVCYKQAHRNTFFIITGLIIIVAIVAIKLLLLNIKTIAFF